MENIDDYKALIIHRDGKTDYVGDFHDPEERHAYCLSRYIKEKYANTQIAQKISPRNEAETIVFFLTRLGDIIISNNTTEKGKYGKNGWAVLPDIVTMEALDVLYDFADKNSEYSINLTYGLNVSDGTIHGETIYDVDNNFNKVLDEYSKRVGIEKSTRQV